ncbi:MAG: ABC transporter permease [Candidatus Cloacimonetes bacterium]|nr:ABC transporter permease [Candidatus Cloacimonadota bacterium]
MHLSDSVRSSLHSIFSHKMRSALTLIGITIGVFAVVTMFSTMQGAKLMIQDMMGDLGWNNSIIIIPSSGDDHVRTRRRRWQRFMRVNWRARPFSYSDFEAVRAACDSKTIYGWTESWFNTNALIGDDGAPLANSEYDWVRFIATNNDFFANKTYPLRYGRYFNDFEEKNAVKVLVLGALFAEKYFPGDDPSGEMLTIGPHRCRIIGVLDSDQLNKRNGMNMNPWERRRELEAVYVPLSTGARYFGSNNEIQSIFLQSHGDDDFALMKNTAWQTMLREHKMSHDFRFEDVGAMMLTISDEIDKQMNTWNMTLSAIASISLLVGGIGLFSTLLISINEKMTEIGVRKSVGATERDIFFYFLIESVTLAMMSAVVGVTLSVAIITITTKVAGFTFPLPVEGILLGLGFAAFIGVLSGFYPAWKASKVDPIQAIFYFE